jgi:hypothetical protein
MRQIQLVIIGALLMACAGSGMEGSETSRQQQPVTDAVRSNSRDSIVPIAQFRPARVSGLGDGRCLKPVNPDSAGVVRLLVTHPEIGGSVTLAVLTLDRVRRETTYSESTAVAPGLLGPKPTAPSPTTHIEIDLLTRSGVAVNNFPAAPKEVTVGSIDEFVKAGLMGDIGERLEQHRRTCKL